MDQIIETKICKKCQANFNVTDSDAEFYKKMEVPTPTMCPTCSMQRIMAFRKEVPLYRRKCDLTGKTMVSLYPPSIPYTIYAQDVWWSEQWDPFKYGRDFDFNRPFFEQFDEFLKTVPHMGITISHGENSDYCPHSTNYKDSYLCISGKNGEDIYYSYLVNNSRNCIDCYACSECELCYECIQSYKLYSCLFCKECRNSNDLRFCYDCEGCSDCIGCYGLRHKKYQIFNKQVEKDEYEKTKEEIHSNVETLMDYRKKANEHFLKYPHPNVQMTNTENCTGDFILNSRNALECYQSENLEDCSYVWNTPKAKDCHNMINSSGLELVYNSLSNVESYNCFCNVSSWNVKETAYCFQCFYSNNLFASIGLRHQKYCIFNKKYSETEYEELLKKIKKHMENTGELGEFFPTEISPFAYNETIAQQWFKMTKEEVANNGWKWEEYPQDIGQISKKIKASELPKSIEEVPDNQEMFDWGIECEETGKLFKIIPQELKLYRFMKIPLPRIHPIQRHLNRQLQINPRKQYQRNCAKCGANISTTYAPDRPEIIYCEKCYLETII